MCVLESYHRASSRALIARRNLCARVPRATTCSHRFISVQARFAHNSLMWRGGGGGGLLFRLFNSGERPRPSDPGAIYRAVRLATLLEAFARNSVWYMGSTARPNGPGPKFLWYSVGDYLKTPYVSRAKSLFFIRFCNRINIVHSKICVSQITEEKRNIKRIWSNDYSNFLFLKLYQNNWNNLIVK